MKALGLGSPDDLRVHFDTSEMDVLVDVLRALRAEATCDAAQIYATVARSDARPIDDRHDRLRDLEGLLIQLEEQQPDNRTGATLVAETPLMSDVAHEGTREALKRLQDAYNRYEVHATPGSRDTLLGAAKTAEAWLTTLTAVDHVDQGWDA